MKQQLVVRLLGSFSADYGGVALAGLYPARLQALFAYLILNPNAHTFREQLAFQFWPDSSEIQSRTNLRHLIHKLRQVLPDSDRFIDYDGQTLKWRAESPYSLDVRQFEQLLAFPTGGSPDMERFHQAVDIYQGDLLPGCYDDWIIPERERLRRGFMAALETLAETAESGRDYTAALEYAHRLLDTDLLHENANRQVIRLLAVTGQRLEALRRYQLYAALVKRELGTTPDAETRELFANLNRQPGLASSTPDTLQLNPLVGRGAEWQKLRAIWRNAASGSPQAVFVTGVAGIGKTHLVRELVQWAARQGIQARMANCYPVEGSLPYAPVVSWLDGGQIPPLEDVWLTELSRFIPELLEGHSTLTAPAPLVEEWQRQRLFEALARAFLCNGNRLLLVIEDIHWCDQDTLEWLHYLLRFNLKAKILLVATERSGETFPIDHPLKRLRTSLASEGKFSEIALGPLNKSDCFQVAAQMARQVSHGELNPELADNIFQETEGNPLFVVEMVRSGHTFQPDGLRSGGATQALSGKVQAVLTWRVNQLSPPTLELASLAATIGREFRPDILKQAGGVDDDALVAGLNELLERQVVQEQNPDRYDFTHDKLREAICSGLSTAHRRLLHRKVAEAILFLAGEDPHLSQAEVASHYERAGLALPAIHHYRLASEAAAKIFSHPDALQWLQHAITLAESLRPGAAYTEITSKQLSLLYSSLGDLFFLTGKTTQAMDQFQKALVQPFVQAGGWKSAIFRKISEVHESNHHFDDAHAALDMAEKALELAENPADLEKRQEWINLRLKRGQLYYWASEPNQMELVLNQVIPEVEAWGSQEQRIELLSIQLQYRFQVERFRLTEKTVEIARQKRALCAASGESYASMYSQFQLGFTLLWHGKPEEAQPVLVEALSRAEKMGARKAQSRCITYLSITSRQLKQVEALRCQTEQVYDLATNVGEVNYAAVAWANRAWLAWKTGDDRATIEHGTEALDTWVKYPSAYVFHWLALWPMLAVAVKQQRQDQAVELARRLLDPEQQPVAQPIRELLESAIQAQQSGDEDRAWAGFRRALEKAQELGDL